MISAWPCVVKGRTGAPLTATVLAAVPAKHAGMASAVNNDVVAQSGSSAPSRYNVMHRAPGGRHLSRTARFRPSAG